eukprot:4555946-Alexandrium_andersonii.AAC.1
MFNRHARPIHTCAQYAQIRTTKLPGDASCGLRRSKLELRGPKNGLNIDPRSSGGVPSAPFPMR